MDFHRDSRIEETELDQMRWLPNVGLHLNTSSASMRQDRLVQKNQQSWCADEELHDMLRALAGDRHGLPWRVDETAENPNWIQLALLESLTKPARKRIFGFEASRS
jgi:hypothetical protein